MLVTQGLSRSTRLRVGMIIDTWGEPGTEYLVRYIVGITPSSAQPDAPRRSRASRMAFLPAATAYGLALTSAAAEP